MTTVADVFVETLEKLGVKRIYGVVGDSLNGITDSIQRGKTIRWMHVRHEESGAFAAGAEAQLTGQLAVCAGSCGPGNLHLINGLFDAHRSNAPVLAIAAHIPTPEIGGNYFQETHPQDLFRECSCYCELLSSPTQMPRMVAMAIQAAITKRGVAVIVIPGDIALSEALDKTPAIWPCHPAPMFIPNPKELEKLAGLINQGKKITIFTGIGCKDAHDEVIALAEKIKAPIVHTLRNKPYIEYNNPYDVGMTGFIGFSSGYYAMEDCDTLLLLGTNFPYRQFYPSNAKIIQIDRYGAALGRRCAIDLGLLGDIKATIPALIPLLQEKNDQSFLEKATTHYQKSRKALDELAVTSKSDPTLIHPQYVAKVVSDVASDDAIFTCDVGTATVWTARYVKMNGKRKLLGSFNHGSMANALSQALGAQSVFPGRQIVAMCGDGGFTMLMGDMLSLIQLKLPVKVVIFNNGTLGFVELEMKTAGFLDIGTDLKNPNFAQIGKDIGAFGVRVEKSADLKGALEEAFAYKGPAIIDVLSNRMELAIPPKVTLEQAKGFSLYMIKALINGRGTDVYQVLKTNLWR